MKPEKYQAEEKDVPFLQLISGSSDDTQVNVIDWRREDAVGPVLKQGSCGGCWAITAAGMLEGAISIQKKSKADVSVQQIIDCASKYNTGSVYVSKGCDGGYLEEAFMYAKEFPLTTNKAYPFTGKNQECKLAPNMESTKVNVKGIYQVGKNYEQISRALKYGPVAAQIDGNSWMLKNYKKGIINKFSACGQNIDHAVLIVGHGYDRITR